MVDTLVQEQLESAPEVTEGKVEEPKAITMGDLEKFKEEAKSAAFEQYKGIQRVVSRVQEENKRLKEQLQQTTDYSTLLELAERQALDYGDNEAISRITQLKRTDLERQRKREYEEQLARQQAIVEDKRMEIETKIRQAGADPEDAKFDNVWLAWELAAKADGDFSRAEKRLEKLIGTAQKVAEPKKVGETPEQLKERLEREILEKHGLLEKEKLSSAGVSNRVFTVSQLEDRNFWEANREEILKAQIEGRIKEG
jgi:hypothetical protein